MKPPDWRRRAPRSGLPGGTVRCASLARRCGRDRALPGGACVAHIGWPRDNTVYYRPAYLAATGIGVVRRFEWSRQHQMLPCLGNFDCRPFHLQLPARNGVSRARDTSAKMTPLGENTCLRDSIRNKRSRQFRGNSCVFRNAAQSGDCPVGPSGFEPPTRPLWAPRTTAGGEAFGLRANSHNMHGARGRVP